jgi:hypothetical protein
MQFIPSTWLIWGGGGNPNNVYDAALATDRYLCEGGRNLRGPAQFAAAIFSYNHSDSYVQTVLLWAQAYASGVLPLPSGPPGEPPFPVAGTGIVQDPQLAGPPTFQRPDVPPPPAPGSTGGGAAPPPPPPAQTGTKAPPPPTGTATKVPAPEPPATAGNPGPACYQ